MTYEEKIISELKLWRKQMLRNPGVMSRISKSVQNKINSWIPEKVHKAITVAVKQMVRGVLFGAKWTTKDKNHFASLVARDIAADEKIAIYQKTAATEGAITGAGGILLGLADFPLLLAIKIKLLFEIASIYGYSSTDYRERLYILHIFQLAFSSAQHRKKVFLAMEHWDRKIAISEKEKSQLSERRDFSPASGGIRNDDPSGGGVPDEGIVRLPEDIREFDWRTFQQEYRDYIDLAKMAQLVPVIGAPVGAVANYQLVKKLGRYAKKAYHLRWAERNALIKTH